MLLIHRTGNSNAKFFCPQGMENVKKAPVKIGMV
jgi:hypothetical protein